MTQKDMIDYSHIRENESRDVNENGLPVTGSISLWKSNDMRFKPLNTWLRKVTSKNSMFAGPHGNAALKRRNTKVKKSETFH